MKQTRSPREQLGLEIAALTKLTTDGMLWRVPSQTTETIYTVNHTQGTCSCTDYGTRKVKCKHLYAIEYTLSREGPEPCICQTCGTVHRKSEPEVYNTAGQHERARR